MKLLDELKIGSWPFWKASLMAGLIGGAVGAFLALIGV